MTPLQIVSTLVCVALIVGYAARRRKGIHVPLMLLAFLTDMALVVYIEVDRDAIASARAKMGPLMIVHIAISVAVVMLYFGQIGTGIANWRGRRSRWHRWAGPGLLLARLGNLVTSLLVT